MALNTESEEEFLKNYNIHNYDVPLASVDSVLFSIKDDEIHALLVQRSQHPDRNSWALPGGFINFSQDHNLEDCAKRKLIEKTGVCPPYLEQLQAIGNHQRDKRGWSITICYYALMPLIESKKNQASDPDIEWYPISKIKEMDLAFDHRFIIDIALERLKQKALYSVIPVYALPETFTLAQLQKLHEIILEKSIQKKSFRRRLEQANVLEDTGLMTSDTVGRPAKLYKARDHSAEYRFIRNLEY